MNSFSFEFWMKNRPNVVSYADLNYFPVLTSIPSFVCSLVRLWLVDSLHIVRYRSHTASSINQMLVSQYLAGDFLEFNTYACRNILPLPTIVGLVSKCL
jgi:hypothetical protein